MSLLLYSKIPGTQVKRDANLSNATVQCDPKLLFPRGALQGGVPLNKENLAGKIAVEHDLCNLDVNNLTVNGTLISNGPAQICDIVCPEDFTVTAGNNIIETATAGDMSLIAPAGNIVGNAGVNVTLTASTGQMVLNAFGTANLFGTAGVKVQGNNLRSSNPTGNQSGGSLNVFPQQPGAKGLHVVCTDTDAGKFGIAADLTGTTILRADGTALNTGATGHLMSAPSGVDTITFAPNAVDITFAPTTNVSVIGVVGNCSDTCGTVLVEPTTDSAVGVNTTLTVTFAKRFPTPFVNVQITAANREGALCTSVHTGSTTIGNEATGFTLNFLAPTGTAGRECEFHYFVMDVVAPATQIG